jgi:hypothetical protein
VHPCLDKYRAIRNNKKKDIIRATNIDANRKITI